MPMPCSLYRDQSEQLVWCSTWTFDRVPRFGEGRREEKGEVYTLWLGFAEPQRIDPFPPLFSRSPPLLTASGRLSKVQSTLDGVETMKS